MQHDIEPDCLLHIKEERQTAGSISQQMLPPCREWIVCNSVLNNIEMLCSVIMTQKIKVSQFPVDNFI
jgi:hypothetical protein